MLVDWWFVSDIMFGEDVNSMFEALIVSVPYDTIYIASLSDAGGCNFIFLQVKLDKLALSHFSCQKNVVATFFVGFFNHLLCPHNHQVG